ncbi:hypothetical protein Tco_1182203 [Tanacetum coccineum]
MFESGFERVEKDAYVILTLVLDTQKVDEPVQSSSVSSNFTSKLLNLKNPSPADNEIASLMITSDHHAIHNTESTNQPTTSEFDRYMDNKLGKAINKAILAHNLDCTQEAQDEKNAYIELIDMSMRALIKEEVNTQIHQSLPQAVLDFANPVIEKNVTESVEAAVLTRSSSQPTSTYEASTSLSEFELTKILIDKIEKNKSYVIADYKKKLYDALVESYNTDKDFFDSYGEVFSLKRSRDDSDKDRDPSAGSEIDLTASMCPWQIKSSHTVEDSGMQQDQEFVTKDNDEQPTNKEVTKAEWFKKPERPPTPDPDWSKRQQVDF